MTRAVLWLLFSACAPLAAQEEVPAAVHVHTRWSGGALSIREAAEQARSLGLGAVVLSDSYARDACWGPPPLQGLISRTEGRPSVRRADLSMWLAEIEAARRAVPEVAIVPGLEVSPACEWSGSPWREGLRAEDLNLHLLVIGTRPVEAYEELTTPTEGPLRWTWGRLFRCALATGVCLAMLVLLSRRARWLAATAAILAVAWFPLRRGEVPLTLPAGEPGEGTLSAASRWGLRTSWAHPEALEPDREATVHGVRIRTRRYPERLLLSPTTAFPSIYGDAHTAAAPGREWDRALLDFVEGRREAPLWGIGEADFRGNGAPRLDTYETVFLADGRSAPAVERALARGSCYAAFAPGGKRVTLRMRVTDPATGREVGMGGTIETRGPVRVVLDVSGPGSTGTLTAVLQGRVWKEAKGPLPLHWEETLEPQPGRRFLRAVAAGDGGACSVGNPVFVDSR